ECHVCSKPRDSTDNTPNASWGKRWCATGANESVPAGSGVFASGGGKQEESTMMSARWMRRGRVPRKDVATLRKALGTCWQRVIQGYPNGATPPRQRGDTTESWWGDRGNGNISDPRGRERITGDA